MSFKHKKFQKGVKYNRNNSKLKTILEKNGSTTSIFSINFGKLTEAQIKSFKQQIKKKIKKKSNIICFKIKPNITITKKPTEVRMGKGKGNVFGKIFKTKKNTVLCQIKSKSSFVVHKILKQAKYCLPFKTKII